VKKCESIFLNLTIGRNIVIVKSNLREKIYKTRNLLSILESTLIVSYLGKSKIRPLARSLRLDVIKMLIRVFVFSYIHYNTTWSSAFPRLINKIQATVNKTQFFCDGVLLMWSGACIWT